MQLEKNKSVTELVCFLVCIEPAPMMEQEEADCPLGLGIGWVWGTGTCSGEIKTMLQLSSCLCACQCLGRSMGAITALLIAEYLPITGLKTDSVQLLADNHFIMEFLLNADK